MNSPFLVDSAAFFLMEPLDLLFLFCIFQLAPPSLDVSSFKWMALSLFPAFLFLFFWPVRIMALDNRVALSH